MNKSTGSKPAAESGSSKTEANNPAASNDNQQQSTNKSTPIQRTARPASTEATENLPTTKSVKAESIWNACQGTFCSRWLDRFFCRVRWVGMLCISGFVFSCRPMDVLFPLLFDLREGPLGEMPSLPLHHCAVDWSIDENFQKQQLNDVHERLSIRNYSMAFRCAAIFDKIARLFFRKSPWGGDFWRHVLRQSSSPHTFSNQYIFKYVKGAMHLLRHVYKIGLLRLSWPATNKLCSASINNRTFLYTIFRRNWTKARGSGSEKKPWKCSKDNIPNIVLVLRQHRPRHGAHDVTQNVTFPIK